MYKRQELERALSLLDIPYDAASVDKLIKRFDANSDGKISYDEFRQFLVRVPAASLAATLGYWQRAVLLNINDDDMGYLPVTPTSQHSAALINSLAGASSSVLAKTSTAPLERCKVIFQMQATKPPGIARLLTDIYKAEGLAGLFRGNLMNLIKSSPESAVKFAIFERMKDLLETEEGKPLSSGRLFLAGSVAGVGAHAAGFPLEVLKTEFAGSAKGQYSSIMDCVQQRYRASGVKGFYRGLTPVVLAAIPHSGTSLATYQLAKDYFAAWSATGEVTTLGLMGAATFSTICGQLVSAPLHVVKVCFYFLFLFLFLFLIIFIFIFFFLKKKKNRLD